MHNRSIAQPVTAILQNADRAQTIVEKAKQQGGAELVEALLMCAAKELYVEAPSTFIGMNRIYGAIQKISDHIMTLPEESDTAH